MTKFTWKSNFKNNFKLSLINSLHFMAIYFMLFYASNTHKALRKKYPYSEFFSVFRAGNYGPEKFRKRTFFTQWSYHFKTSLETQNHNPDNPAQTFNKERWKYYFCKILENLYQYYGGEVILDQILLCKNAELNLSQNRFSNRKYGIFSSFSVKSLMQMSVQKSRWLS